jgi:NADPH:quinone reductase-like Zn-dependent oxidoreductase
VLRATSGRLSEGTIQPTVATTFPLDQAAEAHHLISSRGNTGKVVLLTSPDAAAGDAG